MAKSNVGAEALKHNARTCMCGGRTQVINSRIGAPNYLYRRRVCKSCGERYSTIELRIDQLEELKSTSTRDDSINEVIQVLQGMKERQANEGRA